jgi:hypothetical protein
VSAPGDVWSEMDEILRSGPDNDGTDSGPDPVPIEDGSVDVSEFYEAWGRDRLAAGARQNDRLGLFDDDFLIAARRDRTEGFAENTLEGVNEAIGAGARRADRRVNRAVDAAIPDLPGAGTLALGAVGVGLLFWVSDDAVTAAVGGGDE